MVITIVAETMMRIDVAFASYFFFVIQTKKDNQSVVLFCVGVTYFPGPSPGKYLRRR